MLEPASKRETDLINRLPLSVETLVVLAVCLVIIALNLLSGLSSRPGFCGICHGDEYKAWQQSSHRETDCNFCHRRPTILGLASQRLEVTKMVLRYPLVRFYNTPVTASIYTDACLQCHSSIKQGVLERNGIRMSHVEPDKSGYGCADCHGRIAHGKSASNSKHYFMSTCLGCHSGDQSKKCETCHAKNASQTVSQGSTWRLTHGENWRSLHGMGDLKSCPACHVSGQFCIRCHQTEMPHSSSWLNGHGKEAKRIPSSCNTCHKKSYCNSCHGLNMPHPASFLKQHSTVVKSVGRGVCDRCHRADSCENCHVRHMHPGVDPNIIRSLRKELRLGG